VVARLVTNVTTKEKNNSAKHRQNKNNIETTTRTKSNKLPFRRAAGDLSTLSMLETRMRGDKSLMTNKATE
jgi:hypothetical protein